MRWIITALLALIAGFAGAAAFSFSGLGDGRTRDYLMANPEVLPEAMAELQRRDTAERIAPLRAELTEPFPGAVLGNPQGTITLIEFSDYACSFCRQSLADVNALIADNPDLRVVLREYPVLSAESADAARMALAAAQQGKFEAFHNAMFAADGLSEEAITAAAQTAGVDLAAARAAIDAGTFDTQLENNVFLGQSLRLSGTPAFIIGDEVFNGAVGVEVLAEAIAEARDL
ncbi:DsbA family protein [Erythrobacter sp. EC-HK427]|uniref:DsbA family protein n=1 Tax=Erythrobacter sp. EC-HK427 TaxID=2038396 RepID=UPI001255DEDC|nr:DsbA family protein [Erythrobacter sp. EC-HK427]VVT02832.1 27kDa outer membrane protein [Erythrobacter sp. EC-HK427]